MAAYQCLHCEQIEDSSVSEDNPCCEQMDLFCINSMPGEIVRLRKELAQWQSFQAHIVNSPALEAVLKERYRQIFVEGFDERHDDDRMSECQLATAAAVYATCEKTDQLKFHIGKTIVKRAWPWPEHWWKPGGSLVRTLATWKRLVHSC